MKRSSGISKGVSFTFGNLTVYGFNHKVRKQGLLHHSVEVKITLTRSTGTSYKSYLKHEIIDLLSLHLGYNPLDVGMYGARVVLEKGQDCYELHWNTGGKING